MVGVYKKRTIEKLAENIFVVCIFDIDGVYGCGIWLATEEGTEGQPT